READPGRLPRARPVPVPPPADEDLVRAGLVRRERYFEVLADGAVLVPEDDAGGRAGRRAGAAGRLHGREGVLRPGAGSYEFVIVGAALPYFFLSSIKT